MKSDLDTKPAPRASTRLPESVVDNVDVTLESYLGAAVMRVAELKRLENGSVVTLDAPLNAAIELRLNGLTVAHGELVAVGDHFGVRITALAP